MGWFGLVGVEVFFVVGVRMLGGWGSVDFVGYGFCGGFGGNRWVFVLVSRMRAEIVSMISAF